MSFPYRRDLTEKARALRKNATPQENRLWYRFLRKYPLRFTRQKPIGSYIADFYCRKANLVIELDGVREMPLPAIAMRTNTDLSGGNKP